MAHTVALLRPQSRSASATELLERLRGELLSVGFEVTVRDRPTETDLDSEGAEPWQRALTADGKVEAAIDLVGGAVPLAVDVWIIDDTQHFQRLARVSLDTNNENASKALAIRASEVLRARLFETHSGAEPLRQASTTPKPPIVEPSTARNPQSGFGFELGAAALASLDGVGPAILPMVRLNWAIESQLILQATFAGFGTRPNVASTAGNAEVAMQYGLLGACYRVNWRHRVKPLGALSLGALRTAVVGQAELPREGRSVDQWSFLVDASLGAAFELSSRFAVMLSGHAQLAEPAVDIHFADQKVASLGRPNLLLTLTFGVWP